MSRAAWLVVLWLGCGESAAPASVEPPTPSANEPIRVTRGARTLEVSCQLDCAPLRSELERLSAGCRRDPLSTPHAVTTSPTAIGVGCCEEAASAYRDACGDEHLGPCTSEWLARCERAATLPASSGEAGS
jgi:hypothetical protein